MKKRSLLETELKDLPYFNKSTLEVILEKKGENLNYWIKKLLDRGELISFKKGLYVSNLYLLSIERNPSLKEAYLEYLANIIRYPSYISLEYALAKYGLIPEGINIITSVTVKSSRIFENDLASFVYRSIKPKLFFGFVDTDFEDKKVRIASRAKALFDFLYFKRFPSKKFLKEDLLRGLRINWDVLTREDKREFKNNIFQADSYKMRLILDILKKERLF